VYHNEKEIAKAERAKEHGLDRMDQKTETRSAAKLPRKKEEITQRARARGYL